MLPLVSRMGIVIIASFTLTMLLAATTDWALRQTGGGLHVNLILSVLFPITFFLCSIVMEYIEDGNLVHSVRASLFNIWVRGCGGLHYIRHWVWNIVAQELPGLMAQTPLKVIP